MDTRINFPDDITIEDYLGKGGRANVYKARINSEPVIAKVYHDNVVKKYLDKYKVDIAEHEYNRNLALYKITTIKKYIAKPFRLYTMSSEYTHSIIQEYVAGKTLKELISDLGTLPDEILNIGYEIVKEAEIKGIHDLDISVGNVLVRKENNKWTPKLYDFNIMPQYLFPPNFIVGLGYRLGIRKKSFRDYRSLKNWERRGKNKKWIGRN